MLQDLGEQLRECYLRAEQCRQMANSSVSRQDREDWLKSEQRWMVLARGYETIERIESFQRR
jgi:hypothetical protein